MIRVRELSKSWRGEVVVDRVSFDVRPGAVTGLLGPNGAGKTTTLKLLLGLAAPDSGTATVDGRNYCDLERATTVVGSALDGALPLASSSPRRFLTMLARGQGVARSRVDEVIEVMGLTSVARRPCRRFSLGMRKRVALSAAILCRPRYLVLDEPANGMDQASTVWLRTTLRQLAAEGTGILLASHLLDEQQRTCDQVVVMAAGRLVAAGPVGAVVSRYGDPHLEVTVLPAETASLQERAGSAGIVLRPGEVPGVLTGPAFQLTAVGDLLGSGGFHPRGLRVLDGGLAAAYENLTVAQQQHKLSALPQTHQQRRP